VEWTSLRFAESAQVSAKPQFFCVILPQEPNTPSDLHLRLLGCGRGGLIAKVDAEHGHRNEHCRRYRTTVHRAVIERLELLRAVEDEDGALDTGVPGGGEQAV
jgi:hypothetical protein